MVATELWTRTLTASTELAFVSLAFLLLALSLRGKDTFDAMRRCWSESRVNLTYYYLDAILVVPVVTLMAAGISSVVESLNLRLLATQSYDSWPPGAVFLLGIVGSDFIGYWRHRVLHTRLLWPVHTIHHSDTQVNWTTLARFHPINPLITVGMHTAFLAILGLPATAIAAGNLVRHFYGYYVHGDFHWTHGESLRYIFVSPLMHRWRHAREVEGSGSNFATVFACFDLAFGTFHLPAQTVPELGIEEPDYPTTWLRQTLYPLRVWAGRGATSSR